MEPLTPKLDDAKRVVVKIGSALLVDRAAGGALRRDWLSALIQDVAELKRQGIDVVLVSSGSIALGRGILNLGDGPLPLERAQAAAAVGQIQLARAYDEELKPYGLDAAQVLVTLADSADRRRYLNARATLSTLLRLGAIPIVNENDTVATDEIRFGDNDRLAAQIAVTVGADRLVLCSDVDGLYTANPQKDPDARHLPLIDTISPEIESMAGGAASHLSKGGMKTKIIAARTATISGCDMCIVDGAAPHPLRRLREGARATWFLAETDPQTARKAWIAATKAQGAVRVDDGATEALLSGRSLLPAGLTEVIGAFDRGDPISIEDQSGHVLGYGLARYTSEEATAIAGKKTGEIVDILGYEGRRVMVHRDDLALLDKT